MYIRINLISVLGSQKSPFFTKHCHWQQQQNNMTLGSSCKCLFILSQAAHQPWPVPPTKTLQTVWPSSLPPWSLSLPKMPAPLELPTSTSTCWSTVALLLPVGPCRMATYVMPILRTATAPSGYTGASQSEMKSQPTPKIPMSGCLLYSTNWTPH